MPTNVSGGDTLPADQVPNGIVDYVNFNSTSDGLLGQLGQLGSDLGDAAKNFLGIKKDNNNSDNGDGSSNKNTFNSSMVFNTASPTEGKDVRGMPQTFRQYIGGGDGVLGYRSQSYLMSRKDFCYCDSLDLKTDFMSIPEVQKIIINEFQPYDQIFLGQTLGLFGGILGFIGGLGKALGEAGGRALMKNAMINSVAKDPGSFYANRKIYDGYGNYIGAQEESNQLGASFQSVVGLYQEDPMLRLLRLFNNGKWLNTYEIPFYNSTYLEAMKGGQWTQEGSKRSWGEGLATALEGFGVYYPITPSWNLDIKAAARDELQVDFYLINKDENWMLRNFKFLHALYSGTQFVMLKNSIVQSPNVYNVVLPGRFEIIWASMTAEATMEGKLRKCSYMYDSLNTVVVKENGKDRTKALLAKPVKIKDKDGKEIDAYQSEVGNYEQVNVKGDIADVYSGLRSIQPDTLWPDAWKISLKIKDLGINCFNNYLNYHMFGASAARLRANTSEQSQGEIMLDKMRETAIKMLDKMGLTGEEREKKIKEIDENIEKGKKAAENAKNMVEGKLI